jgi:hypothetical protein
MYMPLEVDILGIMPIKASFVLPVLSTDTLYQRPLQHLPPSSSLHLSRTGRDGWEDAVDSAAL